MPDILALTGHCQRLIDGRCIDVAPIAVGKQAGGMCQQVGNVVVIGFKLRDGRLSEGSGKTDVRQCIGNAF